MSERDIEQEVKNWKSIALWLADCHAATATYDGMLKSCSAARRKWFKSICKTAADCLSAEAPVNIHPYYPHTAHLDDVLRRCREAAKE